MELFASFQSSCWAFDWNVAPIKGTKATWKQPFYFHLYHAAFQSIDITWKIA